MTNRIIKLVLLWGSAAAILLGKTTPATESVPRAPGPPVRLFNGTNLLGWSSWLVDTRRADPRGVFGVTNGMIRISGEGLGYLATEEDFSDYQLAVEFKWGDRNWTWGDRVGRARDSGVFLHSLGPDGNSHDGRGAFRAAIECQIMQGATGDFLLIRGTNFDGTLLAPRVTVSARAQRDEDGWPFCDFAGERVTLERWGRVNWFAKARPWRDELHFRGPHDLEKADGEWNRLLISCEADRIEVRLNGVKVNEARDVSPRRGRILLQCEGSEIFFRAIELRRWTK